MHRFVPLISIPVVPIFGLLWRMIDNQQSKSFLKNWRSNYENALYSLVVTAIKKAKYHMDKAEVDSILNMKVRNFHMFDAPSMDSTAKTILESVKKEIKDTELSIPELDNRIRWMVMQNINTKLVYNLRASQQINKREFLRHVGFATEQIERARELGFEKLAAEMENAIKGLNKSWRL